MYPLMSVHRLTFTRDLDERRRRDCGDSRGASTTTGRGTPSRSSTRTTRRRPSRRSATRSRVTALQGLSVKLGVAARGPQGDHLRQRGLHRAAAAADARPERRSFPAWATRPPATRPPASSRRRGSRAVPLRRRVCRRTCARSSTRPTGNNTAIYALDPRGLATNEFDINENVGRPAGPGLPARRRRTRCRCWRINTDGRAIVNRNDLEKGLQAGRARHERLLPARLQLVATGPDGKFHEIEVRLKRPGVQVRSRKGYWAPTAEEAAKAERAAEAPPPPAVEKALGNVETRQRDAFISTWLGTDRGENGTHARDLRLGAAAADSGREAAGRGAGRRCWRPSRGGEDFFRGLGARRGRGAAAARGRRAAAQPALRAGVEGVSFDAAAGPDAGPRDRCRTTKGQVLDTFQQEIDGPGLLRHRGPPVDAGRPARPHARASSRRSRATPIRCRRRCGSSAAPIGCSSASSPTYPAGRSSAEVAARLLNRGGAEDGGPDGRSRRPTRRQPYQIDLPLAGLSPGEYVIEIQAKGVSGEATELIAIKVVS